MTVTAPEGPTRLVVEGRLELVQGNPGGHQTVILSTTAGYFTNVAAPPARGAVVSVVDGAGRSVLFRESVTKPGQYETDSLVVAKGSRYTLRIRWQGDDYEAVDSLVGVPPIDSLYFSERSTGGVGPGGALSGSGLRATLDMQDPLGIANYYLWDMYVDGTRIISSDTAFLFRSVDTDQFFDGRKVRGVQPHPDTPVVKGQTVLLRQQSITAQHYRYYKALNDQLNNDGSPFAVPPNSIRGNVANLSRPEVRALGYFLATEVSERTLRVP
ncbi:MAG: DUF4249 domain-containing protein [Gemmatimonas sp.]